MSAAVDAAVGTPAWRRASFIDGLSRHSQVVRTEVPGIPRASRTFAAAIWCDSIVDSSRSTHTRSCAHRDGRVELLLVRHVGDLVVGTHLAAQLVAEVGLGRLAHADDVGSHARQRSDEAALVLRKGRLDEDDVHAREPSGGSPSG